MTFISRKTRLLVPHWLDECDPGYLYQVNRKRSDGRLKRHSSCDDLRAWVDDEYLNYQYFLELMYNGEDRPFLGLMGRFIPIETILDILCGNKWHEGDENTIEGAVTGLGAGNLPMARPGADASGESVPVDSAMRIAAAAMARLENISNILRGDSSEELYAPCDQKSLRREDTKSSFGNQNSQMAFPEENEQNQNKSMLTKEEYMMEYQNILRKISCLEQKLNAIKAHRVKLNAKIKKSRNRMYESSSDMTVKELFSREAHANLKRLEKSIVKLVAERGQVLKEMCQEMKHLNELKSNFDENRGAGADGKRNKEEGRPCTRRNGMNSAESVREKKMVRSSRASFRNPSQDTTAGMTPCQERIIMPCRKCERCPKNLVEPMYLNSTIGEDSSRGTSTSSVPQGEPQRTYDPSAANEPVPDRKSRSETTMTEVEQTIRSYDQRLREYENLEVQIEALKKKAAMANYFKTRWQRCSLRERGQKTADRERMLQHVKRLCTENRELKTVLQESTARFEKDQAEMQHMRIKQLRMADMEEEILERNKELEDYRSLCKNQREHIRKLESTISSQRQEIERLLHATRACKASEEPRQRRSSMIRSRSYGPDRKASPQGKKPPVMGSSEEEIQHPTCLRCNCHVSGASQGPKSKCRRRIPSRETETNGEQHMCRRLSCYN